MKSLAEKIRSGSFTITTELSPPKGTDLSELFEKATLLKSQVDAINLTDSPRARMSAEPRAVGRLLLERGIEPIIQMTARDRNRIAIQGDLLGGALLGLNNYVFMSGDQPQNGDHPDAKGVFDWNATDMLRAARSLNAGRDASGAALKGGVNLFVGATANPAANDLAAEIENTKRKIDAGAEFLQTQALYDPEKLSRFIDAIGPHSVPMLVGIIPLKSLKMALWLNENVPGIEVPHDVMQQMASVTGAQAELAKGMQLAAELMAAIKPLCSGVHVMAMGLEARIPDLVRAASLR